MARKRARTRTTPRSRTKGGKVAKISVVNSGEHGPTVLVIGAGPSGLVSLKTLRENGYNAVCVESSGHIGGTFYNKTYDDGALVSSKYITAFSDFRWDSETRPHPTIDEYLEYNSDRSNYVGVYEDLFEVIGGSEVRDFIVNYSLKSGITESENEAPEEAG